MSGEREDEEEPNSSLENSNSDSEEYEWDNYRENPSFLESPSGDNSIEQEEHLDPEAPAPSGGERHSSTDNFFLDENYPNFRSAVLFDGWPPRNPSSESDFGLTEENLLPSGLLDCINEEPEVFEEEMPPKSANEVFESFSLNVKNFNRRKNVIKKRNKPPDEETIHQLEELYDEIEQLENELEIKAADRFAIDFANVKDTTEGVYADLLDLKDMRIFDVPTDKDGEECDGPLFEMQAKFNLRKESVLELESSITQHIAKYPTVDKISHSLAEKLEQSLRETKNLIESAYIDYIVVISKLDAESRDGKKEALEQEWKDVKSKLSLLFAQIAEYTSKYVSTPNAATTHKSPLARLPLPTFRGVKTEYLRFKEEFRQHVKYDSEEEKLLALKTTCLVKAADKTRVANELTLNGCWSRLDAEYGDVASLVADIFASWDKLKTPTNDAQLIKFIDTIEQGKANLKAAGHENQIDCHLSALNLEKKLPSRILVQFSLLMAENPDDPRRNRMQILLDLLAKEKRAAHLRSNDTTSQKNDDAIKTNSVGTRGTVNRGGRGRGRGGGGFRCDAKSTRNPGLKGKQKRGEKSKNCILCTGDHSTGTCPHWRDKKTNKCELFCLAITFNKKHQDVKFCTWCLETGHTRRFCHSQEDLACPCGSDDNVYICVATDDCKSRANWTDTHSNTAVISSHVSVNGSRLGQTLLPVQSIPVEDGSMRIRVMFDNGSQSTFILNQTARKLKLKGIPISYVLVCTDGERKKMNGVLYKLSLIDGGGNTHFIEAVGLDKISSSFPGVKVFKVKAAIKRLLSNSEFSMYKSLTDKKLSRTDGQLDLLVGTDLSSLHPKGVFDVGKVTLMKSIFCTGWTLMGYDKKYVKFTGDVVGTKANFCSVESIEPWKFVDGFIGSNAANTKDVAFLDALSTESIGINVPPKCAKCKAVTEHCNECQLASQSTSYLEWLEDKQITDSIEYLNDEKKYIASYPYTSELNNLLPNKEVALRRAISLENTLKKKPEDLKAMNDVLFDSFSRGVFRFLSQKEIDEYTGQIHYVPYNRVYKDSDSTPIRLVFDSGQPDKNGLSLNGTMGKGKNPLNHFGSVVLNFRCCEKVACGDISKMFNQIKVRKQDQHLRRFLVRPDGFGGKEPFQTAVITCINFGEKAAGSVATAVKNKCAEDNKAICPEVARNLVDDCFMDDVNVDCKYDEDIDEKISKAEQIMSLGGFQFKKWVKSGDAACEKELGQSETLPSKSLGMYWKTEEDKLVYRIKLNFSSKSRNRYSGPDSSLSNLDETFPEMMTKRIALKLNHTVFDPGNLIQPWLLKLRLAYREILLFEKENNISSWDAPLPSKFHSVWLDLCKEMFQLEALEFDRSLIPKGYDYGKKPTLVLFSDGSDLGQCCVAYFVWDMLDGSRKVSLVTSRTKIAAMMKITTPRSELTAAQLNTRLKVWLLNILKVEVGSVIHIVDASIILGMIKNISLKFDTFSAPRVTEIQTNTTIENWFWVDTRENPADVGTRGKVSVSDLNENSFWRNGPAWLKLPSSEWPLKSDFKKESIPGIKKEFTVLNCVSNLTQLMNVNEFFDVNLNNDGTVKVNQAATNESNATEVCKFPEQHEKDISKEINFLRFSCWFKLLRISAQVLIAIYLLCKAAPPLFRDAMNIVKYDWLRSMMPETKVMLKTTKLSGFLIHEKDGIIFATTRTKSQNYNAEDLPILSPKHKLTRLILRSIHEISHRGVNYTVARSRLFYWIPQAKKIVKSIIDHCYTCRVKNAEAMKQLMSPLPESRLKPTPVWHFSMVDLFGPINVRGFVNKRTTRKTWGVIITCLTTRAVQCYAAESFSTDDFLMVLRKHEARNGSPNTYHADLGSQIVGADNTLREAVENLNVKTIQAVTARRNVNFSFGTPHFPEGQGAVERLVQEVKKNLKVITSGVLSFGELDTALAEASYLVNCRPLQPHPGIGEDGYVCPNDVLMGRSDKAPAEGNLVDSNLTFRVSYVKKLMDEFWQKWSTSYYQSLVKYHRWKLAKRNAKPDDIVLILDRESSKGKFTLGRISSVKIDPDGIVRKVTVQYKIFRSGTLPYESSSYKYVERNVRNLALIVTAEERENLEVNVDESIFIPTDENDGVDVNIDTGLDGFSIQNQNADAVENVYNDVPNDDDVRIIDENYSAETNALEKDVEDVPIRTTSKDDRKLPRTSSGRIRWKPERLNL